MYVCACVYMYILCQGEFSGLQSVCENEKYRIVINGFRLQLCTHLKYFQENVCQNSYLDSTYLNAL